MLNKNDKEYLIKCLNENIEIPQEYKYTLFPTAQKECELVYAGKMRKEDILSDTDEISNVPLQVERTFSGEEHSNRPDNWKNLLIFGDNLQVLKTMYYDKDSLITGKVKGKVKLIYIDPPFATDSDFKDTVKFSWGRNLQFRFSIKLISFSVLFSRVKGLSL